LYSEIALPYVFDRDKMIQKMVQSERMQAKDSSGASILVVDDDADVRDGLCDALRDEGFHVTTASDGAAAVRQIATEPAPDLVLLDLRMPVMDGRKFLERRATDQTLKQIPVIVVSATADSRLGLDQPGVEIVRKPVDLDALLRLIRRQLVTTGPSA
jgi:CheY-like chemotaxis protein